MSYNSIIELITQVQDNECVCSCEEEYTKCLFCIAEEADKELDNITKEIHELKTK